jgi:serine/threonine protein kinase
VLVGASSIPILAAFVARGSSVLELVLAASWLVAIATLSAGVSRLAWNLRGEIAKAERAGAYLLEHRLHEGPNAIVFRATHALLERPAAVKVLVPEHAAGSEPASFTRGARLMARLSHAHSTRVYDYGRSVEGSWYVAMELVEGITLEEAHAVDPAMPAERVVHIARQIAGALAEAHELGLLHGAIVPRHLMLTQQGGEDDVVKVLDFGGRTTPDDRSFRAPEVELGPHAADARADVYSVGAIARFLLGASTPSVELDVLLASAIDRDPDRRPRSAREFARALDELAAHRPWTRDDATRWWRSNDAALRSCEALRS